MLLGDRLLYFRDNVVVFSSRLAIPKKDIWASLTFKMKPTLFLETSGIDYPAERKSHVGSLWKALA
jgi:hypothetical protein